MAFIYNGTEINCVRCHCPGPLRVFTSFLPRVRDVRWLALPSAAPRRARVAMALSELSGDEQGVLFVQLCNVLDPGIAVALSSVNNELRTATQVPLQQLKTDHKAAAALRRKLGHRNCKELREAKMVAWYRKGLSSDDLALLGTLGSVLPALEELRLNEPAAGPDGVPRLAEKLGAGALPAVTLLYLNGMRVGTNGAPLRSSND